MYVYVLMKGEEFSCVGGKKDECVWGSYMAKLLKVDIKAIAPLLITFNWRAGGGRGRGYPFISYKYRKRRQHKQSIDKTKGKRGSSKQLMWCVNMLGPSKQRIPRIVTIRAEISN